MIEEDNSDRSMKWEVLKSEYLFERPWLTVRREHVRMPNGAEAPEFYILEYPDWVNVIAITENDEMVMIRQYRHGVKMEGIELCAGVIEDGESPEQAAKRELLEETGFGGGEWTHIYTIAPNPSTQTNFTHCFLARNVRRLQAQNLDGGEDIAVKIMSQTDVLKMIKDNTIIQALMIAPLWKYFATFRKDLL